MELKDLITPNVCHQKDEGVFSNWYWYCDECVEHGSGAIAQEVHEQAMIHARWNTKFFTLDEETATEEDYEKEDNWILFPLLSEEEQEFWEEELVGSNCGIYIIDATNNKTFDWFEDYTDTTPNKIEDLELAQKLRKQFGLP
jgi:hypothetical protein